MCPQLVRLASVLLAIVSEPMRVLQWRNPATAGESCTVHAKMTDPVKLDRCHFERAAKMAYTVQWLYTNAIYIMFSFSKKKSPDLEMQINLLIFLANKLSNSGKYLHEIAYIRKTSVMTEKYSAMRNIYFDIERELIRHNPEKWSSAQSIRVYVRHEFHLNDFIPNAFLLIFATYQQAAIFLLEELTNRLFDHLAIPFNQRIVMFEEAVDDKGFLGKIKAREGKLIWHEVEASFLSSKHIEPLVELEGEFKKIVRRLYNEFTKRFSGDLARLSIENLFRSMKTDYGNTDALSVLLEVMPEGILIEDRFEFYPQQEFEAGLRLRLQEVQTENSKLKEESRLLKEDLDKFKATQEKIEQMRKAQDKFIEVVSHQFRTPLSVIRWESEILAEVLAADKSSVQVREAADAIQTKSIFLIDILNDVFELLVIEAGQFKLNLKPSPLWEMIEELLVSFKADAAKKNVIIVFDKISMPAEAISLDVGRIRSVLNILIRNALNYTPSGGQIVIKLKKEIENDKEVFHLIIQDNGVGIRREDLNKIFSRFYRSPDVIKIIPDGAGLGLFIAKHIIEAHNGRLWAESDGIGKGSSFHVILPKTI